MIIEKILKDSLFPIATEFCYNIGKEMLKTTPTISIILYLLGFSLTKIGILITIIIILTIKFRKTILDFLK